MPFFHRINIPPPQKKKKKLLVYCSKKRSRMKLGNTKIMKKFFFFKYEKSNCPMPLKVHECTCASTVVLLYSILEVHSENLPTLIQRYLSILDTPYIFLEYILIIVKATCLFWNFSFHGVSVINFSQHGKSDVDLRLKTKDPGVTCTSSSGNSDSHRKFVIRLDSLFGKPVDLKLKAGDLGIKDTTS